MPGGNYFSDFLRLPVWQQQYWKSAFQRPLRLLMSVSPWFVWGGCISFTIDYFLISRTTPNGVSMSPTFVGNQEELLLLDRTVPQLQSIAIGDVVVVTSVSDPCQTVIKRVLALPGDYVRLRHRPALTSAHIQQVPPGHIWLQGDNLSASRDSRDYGPVPCALVQGRVFAQVMPWAQRKWVVRQVPWQLQGVRVTGKLDQHSCKMEGSRATT